eukprot:TRINITY_DN1686_c0_g1_i1.p1 TRINITY_DN1686_c0_g1~~TRINITY_DN1686_c0_g1_i1.p1  ORF type:complete len:508 (+),score=159.08 TRINITY_DN1686_c0_g1_i1:144-1667(+)
MLTSALYRGAWHVVRAPQGRSLLAPAAASAAALCQHAPARLHTAAPAPRLGPSLPCSLVLPASARPLPRLVPSTASTAPAALAALAVPVASALHLVQSRSVASITTFPSRKDAGNREISVSEESKVIFDDVWSKVEEQMGRENMMFPKEIIWLMGAPGSGKGTQTPFINEARGITAPPIVMSDLLNDPAMVELKKRGELITDESVLLVLLKKLLEPQYEAGVVVDGFPRTKIQADCVKLLERYMYRLRSEHPPPRERAPAEEGVRYMRRPKFRVAVLFITEEESVDRQTSRAVAVREHNALVRATGQGELLPERPTDLDEDTARERYYTFKQHYATIENLKQFFNFSFINAQRPVPEVTRDILAEFAYQGMFELAEETHDAISGRVPLMSAVRKHARQELIRRLDTYQTTSTQTFERVLQLLDEEIVPKIRRNAISGYVIARVSNERTPLFRDDEAVEMAHDILTERGFFVTVDTMREGGDDVHVFHINFERTVLRAATKTVSKQTA